MDQSCRGGAAPGPGYGDVVANVKTNNIFKTVPVQISTASTGHNMLLT
jgi:hypothetical protein